MMKKYKVIFIGTPSFSVPFLEALIKNPCFEIIGVITEQDRPTGRGRKLKQSAVAEYLNKLQDIKNNKKIKSNVQIPIYKPKKISNIEYRNYNQI